MGNQIQPTMGDLIEHIQSHPNFVFKPHLDIKHQETSPPSAVIQDSLRTLLESDPGLFLEKWGSLLSGHHLSYFDYAKDDYIVCHYLNQFTQQASDSRLSTSTIRNRRLKYLSLHGDYLELESIQDKYPHLYEEYAEQYMSQADTQTSFQSKGLVDRILYDLDQKEYFERLGRAPFFAGDVNDEDNIEEFDTDEEDDVDNENTKDMPKSQEEKDLIHEQLMTLVREAFLNGRDPSFDYSTIDSNPEYDDLAILNADAQDRYFNDESED